MPAHVIDSLFFRDLYGSEEMRAIFDDRNLLQKWLDYEAALARAEAFAGIVPVEAAAEISRKARAELMDIDLIRNGINKTVHPLVSLIWQLSERCENDAGHYVHWGATTQDVMDTAIVLQLKEAIEVIRSSLIELIAVTSSLADEHRYTVMAGRTHGQQALPITFGFKVAVWVSELKRHLARLDESKDRVLTGQFGGAVGTLASVETHGLQINARLMEELGLNVPEIAWHTSRDNFTEFAIILIMVAATCGKIAHEIIDLQKLEMGEVAEPFEIGKVGSSTMPQKRNPMICEAIEAIARLVRSQAVTAIDAMNHEHERDWASFQMEWSYLPEVCVMVHGALKLMIRVASGIKVYPERMLQNLEISLGSILAERVMLELGKFIGRQQAHDVIYQVAMRSFEERRSFAELLKESVLVSSHLSGEQIENLLDPTQYTGLAALYVVRVVGADR